MGTLNDSNRKRSHSSFYTVQNCVLLRIAYLAIRRATPCENVTQHVCLRFITTLPNKSKTALFATINWQQHPMRRNGTWTFFEYVAISSKNKLRIRVESRLKRWYFSMVIINRKQSTFARLMRATLRFRALIFRSNFFSRKSRHFLRPGLFTIWLFWRQADAIIHHIRRYNMI